jgi:hypothetical protein
MNGPLGMPLLTFDGCLRRVPDVSLRPWPFLTQASLLPGATTDDGRISQFPNFRPNSPDYSDFAQQRDLG